MTKFILAATLSALAALGTLSSRANANPLADDVLGSLYSMRGVFRAQYAPAAWKKRNSGYDLETEFKKAVAEVQANPDLTIEQSRKIFKTFIYSMQDYHTSISFALTEKSSLPITVRGAGNRFFIVYIDRQKLSERAFPFKVGDELMAIDGKPTAEVVAALQAEIPGNVPSTDRALAEARLFARGADKGLTIPKGPVLLSIKPLGASSARQVQLIWNHVPERVANRKDFDTFIDLGKLDAPKASFFLPMMDAEVADESPVPSANPFDIGAKQTFIPALGPKVWESPKESSFYAYIYKAPDRRLIGYVRIPEYIVPDYPKAVADFAAIVQRFEGLTDGLVIDQVNNPGGSVFYLYSLVSMLTDQPVAAPRHRVALTQNSVAEAAQLIDKLQDVKSDEDAVKLLGPDMNGYPVSFETAQFMSAYAKFSVQEWAAGRSLSDAYWLGGVDRINPAPVHYTKPILLLINELDFSGGDFFPTILQDNKRVTVMGARTAGAGGYVNDVSVPNNVGIGKYRVTGSLAERVDGNPIENLGVTPDIPYSLTPEDFQTNFAPYMNAIQQAMSKLTK